MKFLLITLFLSHFSLAEIPQILPHPSNKNMASFDKELNSLIKYLQYIPEKIHQSERAVWKIKEKGTDFHATGFFISPNQFVTNFHAMAYVQSLKNIVLYQKENSRKLTINKAQILSATHDLAILEINGRVKNYLKVRMYRAKSDEEIFVSGYPGHIPKLMKKIGRIANTNDYNYSIYTNYSYLRGASGSPLLDEKGQVVGILYSADRIGHVLGAIHINHLHNLLEEYKKSPPKNQIFDSLKADAIQDLKNQMNENEFYILRNGLLLNKIDSTLLNLDDQDMLDIYKKFDNEEDAEWLLMLAYFHMKQKNPNYNIIFNSLTKSAEQGYAPAQYKLALNHMNIHLSFYNEKTAFEWIEKAALQNFAPAQYMLYLMYLEGRVGVEINSDVIEAIHWLEKAALLKYPKAQVELAKIYLANPSYEGSYLMTFVDSLLTEAAQQKDKEAILMLQNQ